MFLIRYFLINLTFCIKNIAIYFLVFVQNNQNNSENSTIMHLHFFRF